MQSKVIAKFTDCKRGLPVKQQGCVCLFVCVVLKQKGREVTSQCVRQGQINHSFSGVCVVSSQGSLGAQDKQCEVGNKVGPSHTLLSDKRFPLIGSVVRATG